MPLLAFAAAGCFTDPINRPPSVTITGFDPSPALRQQALTFHAKGVDPDGDTPRLKWTVVGGDCMPDNPPTSWPPGNDGDNFVVTSDETNGPFCVWVMATDAHNATDTDDLGVNPMDQPPSVNIKVVSPDPAAGTPTTYPLYSTIELSPDGTSDPEGDALDYTSAGSGWVFTQKPGGSLATFQPCPTVVPGTSSGAAHQCFYADAPGDYDVSLTVLDSHGQPGVKTLTIHVNEDQLPCIGYTEPGFTPVLTVERDPSVTNQIVISTVIDDGSPFPQTTKTSFTWFRSVNGANWEQIFTNRSNVFPFPAGSQGIGDSVRVRLEVSDGTQKTAAVLAGCDSSQDLCPANTNTSCYQRATWSIDFR